MIPWTQPVEIILGKGQNGGLQTLNTFTLLNCNSVDQYQSVCKECCNLTVYKLKVFADDNLEYNENGRKFSKWVENTGEKEELLLNSCLHQ